MKSMFMKLSLSGRVSVVAVMILAAIGTVPVARTLGNAVSTAASKVRTALQEAARRNAFHETLFQRAFVATDDAVGISIADDATILLDGNPVPAPGVRSVVVKAGSKISLPAYHTYAFVAESGPTSTIQVGNSSLSVTGNGRGIIFASGALYASGAANFAADGFTHVTGENSAVISSANSGVIRTRKAALVTRTSTMAGYDSYLTAQKTLVSRVFDENKTTGIEVKEFGLICIDGRPSDAAFTQWVHAHKDGKRVLVAEGATTVFTSNPSESIELVGTDGRTLNIKGEGRGVIFPDGSAWLISGNYKLDQFGKVAIADGVTINTRGTVVGRLYQPAAAVVTAKTDRPNRSSSLASLVR